jgi:adenosylcobinamide kinase/adenosylcobinamide-phosphate guanylyltransferase
MPLSLLIGGVRSGKSALAVALAARQSSPIVFLATAQAGDADMAERIAAHARERPASWQTIEEPLQLRSAIEDVDEGDCLIVDCLTLWTANALEAFGAGETETCAMAAARVAAARPGLTVAVTNEVGMGIHPQTPLGRSYRDLLGRVNVIWADAADDVYLLVAGRALALARTDSLGGRLP